MKTALFFMDRRVDEFLGVCIQDAYMAGEGPVEEYRADLFRLLGFTREDVRRLKGEACFVGSGGLDSEDDDAPYETQEAREIALRAIADRIEALLPPEALD